MFSSSIGLDVHSDELAERTHCFQLRVSNSNQTGEWSPHFTALCNTPAADVTRFQLVTSAQQTCCRGPATRRRPYDHEAMLSDRVYAGIPSGHMHCSVNGGLFFVLAAVSAADTWNNRRFLIINLVDFSCKTVRTTLRTAQSLQPAWHQHNIIRS